MKCQTFLRYYFPCGFLIITLLLLASCSGGTTSKPEAAPAKPVVSDSTAKADWEIKWDKWVEAAKKENRLVIYSSGGEDTRKAFGEGFKNRFGIESEWVGGRGPELSEKIMTERRAGLHIVDIVIGASQPLYVTLKPSGAVQKLEQELILPEVTDPKAWFLGEFPWLDKDHYIMSFMAYPDTTFIVNTDMAKAQEVSSFKNILNPKWKGKLVMDDPTFPGSGGAFFIGVAKIMGMDYMRELAKQEPLLTRDRRLLIEWVARGKYAIGIAPHTPFIPEFQRAGVPLEIGRPAEGSYFSSGIGILAMMSESPHPNAARVFVNWALSKEGQIAHAKETLQQSYRDDIPVDYLPPIRVRDPKMNYFPLVTEEYLQNYNDNIKKAQEIFGALNK